MISAAVNGIESKCVLVEADVSDGLPMFSMVGYLASEVREAQDRVRTALSEFRLCSSAEAYYSESGSG